MALTTCKECKKDISSAAAACPHCGYKPTRIGLGSLIVLALVGYVVYALMRHDAPSSSPTPVAAAPRCSPGDITIKSLRARYDGKYMKGVGVLTNGCPHAVGVQVKITGLDANGSPVASRDLWPASVSNIAPGDYTFSMDHYLEYDPGIRTFSMAAINVRIWQK